MSYKIDGVGSDWKVPRELPLTSLGKTSRHVRIPLVLSIFLGAICALSLIIRELLNAPIGYESEGGFHFGDGYLLSAVFPPHVVSGHFYYPF